MLSRATKDVRSYTDNCDFEASWVLVATWDKAEIVDTDEKVSFQSILVTDGVSTYTWTYYFDVNVEPPRGRKAAIGYSVEGQSKSNMYSLTDVAFRLSIFRGNTRKGPRGLWFTTLSTKSSNEINFGGECLKWYRKNIGSVPNYSNIENQTPFVCPCNEFHLRFDGRFFPMERRQIQEKKTTCYSNYHSGISRICCYKGGVILTVLPDAGTLVSTNPFMSPKQYYLDDEQPKDHCCYKSSNCNLYFRVRPIGTCYHKPLVTPGFSFGDPHITTLDGKEYTFNGWGEYTMVKIRTSSVIFDLQARTDLATNSNGTKINATIFSGFAGKDRKANVSFQVMLSNTYDSMYILVGDDDYTIDFNQHQSFIKFTDGLVLRKKENKTASFSFINIDIEISIQVGLRQLTVSVNIPNVYKKKMHGLMGNFDGDSTNDFRLPTGTILSNDDTNTEKKLFHNFGGHWAISCSESAFRYEIEKPCDRFSHPDFNPLFVEDFPADVQESAKILCGVKNKACIFDYLATKDDSFAKETKTINNEAQQDIKDIDNSAPILGGKNTLLAYVGKPSFMLFNATDVGSNVTYKILNQPDSNFYWNQTNGLLNVTWIPTNLTAQNLSVTADDNVGLSAIPITVTISLCPNCKNNGNCSGDVVEYKISNYFKVMQCVCDTGYSGNDCSDDFKGCSNNPCALGRNCTDLTPEQEKILGRSFNCSKCPVGYEVDSTEKCKDVNECNSTASHQCDQKCINTKGSYVCDCEKGFRMSNRLCIDIDECVEKTSGCQQICTNTPGNYTCGCYPGFELVENSGKCNQSAVDMCSAIKFNCSHGCKNTTNGYQCFCNSGYILSNDSYSCENINECTLPDNNVCDQICTDTAGHFTCSCRPGYKLSPDKISCEECQPPFYGDNCRSNCSCGPGALECNHVSGCKCDVGFKGIQCDDDIDECIENPNICGTQTICSNTQGSYTCSCPDGYALDRDGLCKDVDECISQLHNCFIETTECRNTVGGYTCTCKQGYTSILNNTHKCQDINECKSGSHNCQQKCINTRGRHVCACNFGFELKKDRQSCEKVSDPCKTYNMSCKYGCIIKSSKPTCYCPSGYRLNSDRQSCQDIDECKNSRMNKCSDTSLCSNIAGSYQCKCPTIGTYLQNDKRTCTKCDEFHYGEDCSKECECGIGSAYCDPSRGCTCKHGWQGPKCDHDKNECSLHANICPGENMECINIPGSFLCQCKSGYANKTNDCTDIDECQQDFTCDHKCSNTNGSYICSCYSGFIKDKNEKCQDINECRSAKLVCHHYCTNTLGSYRCGCNDGFQLDTDQKTCNPKTICTSLNCSAPGVCIVKRTEVCVCPPGYMLHNSTECSKIPIDECQSNENLCSDDCKDTAIGYECVCPVNGTILDTDQHTCIDCMGYSWGRNCSQSCHCNKQHTEYCNKVNGTCFCKVGWTGKDCNEDIKECNNTGYCPTNSKCNEQNGTFECICNDGFFLSDVGEKKDCIPCTQWFWGEECENTCTCDDTKTSFCNNTNGFCSCVSGWKGENCTENVDECRDGGNKCGRNSTCNDTIGSYTCACDEGYQKNNNDSCKDINECLTGSHDCSNNAECVNLDGTFQCKCNAGFTGDGHLCHDIDECASSDHDCDQNCTNSEGTYSCSCFQGYSIINRRCHDIDECQTGNNNCHMNATCRNEAVSFLCICNANFEGDGITCSERRPPTTPAVDTSQVVFHVLMHINYHVSFPLDNHNTPEYKWLWNETLHCLTNFYSESKALQELFVRVDLIRIMKGSIIANASLVTKNTTDHSIVNKVVAALHEATKEGSLVFNHTKTQAVYSISPDTPGFLTVTNETNPCLNFTCPLPKLCTTGEYEVPSCSQTTTVDSTVLVLSISIPLITVILVIVIIICMLKIRGQRHQEYDDRSVRRTSTYQRGFFGGSAATRLNPWNKGTSPVYGRWDDDANSDRSNDYENADEGAEKSNFTWKFIHETLNKESDFKIQRPTTEITPNPVYEIPDRPSSFS